ncbi:MAG TPA: hypothetical protein VD963_05960, partial [Phycisphaerales bacterium]|nr:hypothetical protein [Phycisphaerales bacterium]
LFPEGYQAGLRYLAGGPAGLDGHCLQVLSPGELDPGRLAPAGLLGDLEFLDAETGRAANVTITPAVVAGYRDSVRAYTATLRAEALRRGLRYQLVTSDTPAHELLLGALRRGGLLG